MAAKPVLWSVESGILVRDLKQSDYYDALRFLIEEYLSTNVVLHSLNIKNCFEDLKHYVQIIQFILKDDTSLIAIDDETKEIVGLLLARPMTKEDYSWNFWKFLIPKNRSMKILMNFERDMVTNNFEKGEYRSPLTCFHVFALCISSKYKRKNQKPRLLIDAYKLARSLGLPKLSFIATSLNDQIRAERIGMEEKSRICYGEYKSRSGKMRIPNYPTGQFYAVHYEMDVGPRCNMSIYESRIE